MSEDPDDPPGKQLDPERYERDRARVEAGFWPKLARVFTKIPFAEEAVAAYYCATDAETPFRIKAVIMGALAYFVVPTDALPDFLGAFGLTDDAAVFWAAWRLVSEEVTEAHRAKAEAVMARLKEVGE